MTSRSAFVAGGGTSCGGLHDRAIAFRAARQTIQATVAGAETYRIHQPPLSPAPIPAGAQTALMSEQRTAQGITVSRTAAPNRMIPLEQFYQIAICRNFYRREP